MGKIRASDLRHPLRATLREQREQLRAQGSASKFALSGMSVSAEGVTTIEGDLVVEGSFTAEGKVSNDALVSPVMPTSAWQGRSNFGVTVAGGYIITINATVPDGFSQVVITAFGRICAVNSTASADTLYSSVDVDGVGGNLFGVPVGASGGFSTTTAGYATLRTGLTAGQVLAVGLYGATGVANWATNAAAGADLGVTFQWLR